VKIVPLAHARAEVSQGLVSARTSANYGTRDRQKGLLATARQRWLLLSCANGLLLRGLFCAAATGHYLIAIIWRDPTATLSGFTKTHTLLTWEIHCASALFAKIAMPLLAQSLRRSAQANRHRPAREPAAAAAASGRRAASVSQGQVSAGQLPGAGSSILRGWPAGTIWTATTLASAAVSLTTLCTSPQPMSVKLSPAV
jgi:hypothetical protein